MRIQIRVGISCWCKLPLNNVSWHFSSLYLCSPSLDSPSFLSQSASQCIPRRPASVGRPGTGSPLGSMERRLRGAVQHCWKEIQRNCAVQDPQQEGHISATSFLGEQKTTHIWHWTISSICYCVYFCPLLMTDDVCVEILQSLNISITQQQLEYLAVKFDFMSNGRVSYHNFLHHLLLNLKPAEAKTTFERCKLPLPNTPVRKNKRTN